MSGGGGGAYRDMGAAIARAEALEREVEELRAEIARLKAMPRTNRGPTRVLPDVEALENEVVNLRAENELLRARRAREATADEIIADLRREVTRLASRNLELEALLPKPEEPFADNREAVLTRRAEERAELERELKEARDRYEAQPPASRDPRTFEEKVLGILQRLVK